MSILTNCLFLVYIDCYFEWKIKIPFHKRASDWPSKLESSRFSAKETRLLDWFLIFEYDDRYSHCHYNKISIRLSPTKEREKADAGVTDVDVKMGIIDNTNKKRYCSDSEGISNENFSLDIYELRRWIVNDTLTVFCEIDQFSKETLAGNSLGTTRAPAVESFLGGDQLFRNQLETFYEKMMLSDVYFDVGDREFKAHKSILALRSPVFAAMFEHPTKEKLTNRVVFEDIEPDVFQELLRFIYTGRLSLSTMNVMATEILAAANKYLLDQLKIECENHLIYRMSADNCLDILLLQDKNDPTYYLRKEAAKFFRSRPDKVMATDRWKEEKEKNPTLYCATFKNLYSALMISKGNLIQGIFRNFVKLIFLN